jgi:hypothetical protein
MLDSSEYLVAEVLTGGSAVHGAPVSSVPMAACWHLSPRARESFGLAASASSKPAIGGASLPGETRALFHVWPLTKVIDNDDERAAS